MIGFGISTAWAWGWKRGDEPGERFFYVGPLILVFEDRG